MKEIPMKVVVLLGAEAGLFAGFGLILCVTLRAVHHISAEHRWDHLRHL